MPFHLNSGIADNHLTLTTDFKSVFTYFFYVSLVQQAVIHPARHSLAVTSLPVAIRTVYFIEAPTFVMLVFAFIPMSSASAQSDGFCPAFYSTK